MQSLEHVLNAICVGQKLPDMTLIRQHLMLEGHLEKQCLVDIVQKTTAVFSK